MILDGRELVGYIQERQARQVRGLRVPPRLAIVRQCTTPSTDLFLRVNQAYGSAIGVTVDTYTESPKSLIERIRLLNQDITVTGIIVQLPLADAPELVDEAIGAVVKEKDVDGLTANSPFDAATPKAILWLLAAYNIDLKAKDIAVVGQGRLVGEPLACLLEASGHSVNRLDDTTKNLKAELTKADIIIAATGQAGLITAEMVKTGAVVVDVGAPRSDLADDLRARTDIKITANPGGVGPVTVAALFDNLLRI